MASRQRGLEGQEKMYSQAEAESELELDPASRRMLVPQELHFSLKIHMCKDQCLTFKGENKTQKKHLVGGKSLPHFSILKTEVAWRKCDLDCQVELS